MNKFSRLPKVIRNEILEFKRGDRKHWKRQFSKWVVPLLNSPVVRPLLSMNMFLDKITVPFGPYTARIYTIPPDKLLVGLYRRDSLAFQPIGFDQNVFYPDQAVATKADAKFQEFAQMATNLARGEPIEFDEPEPESDDEMDDVIDLTGPIDVIDLTG